MCFGVSLAYIKTWKVPKRLVEVSRDVTPDVALYQTVVETRPHSSRMRIHVRQHPWLPGIYTL